MAIEEPASRLEELFDLQRHLSKKQLPELIEHHLTIGLEILTSNVKRGYQRVLCVRAY